MPVPDCIFPASLSTCLPTHAGDILEAEYRITLSEPLVQHWRSAFVAPSRMETSCVHQRLVREGAACCAKPHRVTLVWCVAQGLPVGPTVVPFSQLATLALGMIVSKLTESAVVHLGLYHTAQVWNISFTPLVCPLP